jgi:hypothetical protein
MGIKGVHSSVFKLSLHCSCAVTRQLYNNHTNKPKRRLLGYDAPKPETSFSYL